MLMVMPRARSSGARSIWSNATNSVTPGCAAASTFVIAAVSVVLPWSMWPIVPMLRWVLSRWYVCLLMVLCSCAGARARRAREGRMPRPVGCEGQNPRSCQDLSALRNPSPWVLDGGEGSASDAVAARRSRGFESLEATRAGDSHQHAGQRGDATGTRQPDIAREKMAQRRGSSARRVRCNRSDPEVSRDDNALRSGPRRRDTRADVAPSHRLRPIRA